MVTLISLCKHFFPHIKLKTYKCCGKKTVSAFIEAVTEALHYFLLPSVWLPFAVKYFTSLFTFVCFQNVTSFNGT